MGSEEHSPAPIRLVPGLGNPGERYRHTRHNVGQRTVEELARRFDAGKEKDRFAGRFWGARGPAGPVALLVPPTFMNLSGESVGPAMGSLRLVPAQVLVVHDEMDLLFGTVRGKLGGGTGGNNGLRSLRDSLGSGDFPRIRLGVERLRTSHHSTLAPGCKTDSGGLQNMSYDNTRQSTCSCRKTASRLGSK